ncbi:MAG: viroplasmin family protein [Tannerellaceae bacterium]|jgi:ribonuclease HI|nr:viroplasmin family protein [Tannerellaceae bacterium]
MASGGKYYVVWKGRTPGVYDNWNDCRLQVEGFEKAHYKSFPTEEDAQKAFKAGPPKKSYASYAKKNPVAQPWDQLPGTGPIPNSLSVDAACSGNPGDMEYRGVITCTKQEIFRVGPMPQGTNNVGEFLAIVQGLALLKQQHSAYPIYSDSLNAIKWVRSKKCNTRLVKTSENAQIFNLIERAERWLQTYSYTTRVLKWNTAEWGEIPADFGRK